MIENQQAIEKLFEVRSHLMEGNCPTCRRSWDCENKGERVEIEIQEKESLQGQYREEVEKIPHYKMMQEKASGILEKKKATKVNAEEEIQLNALQAKVAGLLAERQGLNSSIQEEYLINLNEWNQSFNLFSGISANAQEEFKRTIAGLEQAKKDNETKKEHYQTMVQTYNDDIKNLRDKRSDTVTRRLAEQTVLDKLERDIVLAEESVRLIKNFTLQKFQDTLNYIGERATEIINRIPNMANAVIFFENAKETKTGKIKNEVNAVMNLEGDSNVHIKTLSGGERTSADFAIDLAVGEMIESMTQKGVNFLIVDEGFDGLDSISKIECLEILKTLNTDKKILMVDHSSEVKEMVYDIIKVKRINEESFIQ
jgi:DNA repair exonuclease SbcCD ATPase subunit